ncbi:unnamed protein product [Albugo candida]|uniref:Uncharacterized protein n=1 Tax=Albugo candida TaxID=65357 RepID=A0A024GE89_9STRA|nr:unnamed protein product [Albugo candida]|eukprot:CCI44656.1 unnamed protein product [Albugo candida]
MSSSFCYSQKSRSEEIASKSRKMLYWRSVRVELTWRSLDEWAGARGIKRSTEKAFTLTRRNSSVVATRRRYHNRRTQRSDTYCQLIRCEAAEFSLKGSVNHRQNPRG